MCYNQVKYSIIVKQSSRDIETMARYNKSNELAELLRHRITSGRLQVNEQLEAISKLAKRHKTTVATVSKALTNLEHAGYVERFPGKVKQNPTM